MKPKGYKHTEHRGLFVQEAGALLTNDPLGAVARVKRGLETEEFDVLRGLLEITVDEMGQKIGLSVATLSRRRARRQPLDPEHGDKLVRYGRLFWLAVALFDGNETTAREWLKRPARALGGERPLDFAETETGAREVEDLIGRLEHGVYV